jgi:predicted nicotinamide N-methyase
LAVPSLVAAREGADVLATDEDEEALELVERNARENGLALTTARIDWSDPDELVARAPFDLVLAADVLYERQSVGLLLSLLPRLGSEVWLADPGRPMAGEFLERAGDEFAVTTRVRDNIDIYWLKAIQGGSR